MNEQDWIPAHRRLFKGAKKGLPRAVRFVLLELCHEARPTQGVLHLPPEWDTISAVHDRIGGNRKEIRLALEILQIPDSTGSQVLQIVRVATEHRLEIVKWDEWVGPKSSTERSHLSRTRAADSNKHAQLTKAKTLHAVASSLQGNPNATPRVEESRIEERRSDAREDSPREEIRSQTQIRVVPSAPPAPPESVEPDEPAAPESGFDLASRLWNEEYQARFRKAFDHSPLTGSGSDDKLLQAMGAKVAGLAAGEGEKYLRRKFREYLKDPGRKGWLDDEGHPLRILQNDWNKYGQAKETTEPKITYLGILTPAEQAKFSAAPEDFIRLRAGIGLGGKS